LRARGKRLYEGKAKKQRLLYRSSGGGNESLASQERSFIGSVIVSCLLRGSVRKEVIMGKGGFHQEKNDWDSNIRRG